MHVHVHLCIHASSVFSLPQLASLVFLYCLPIAGLEFCVHVNQWQYIQKTNCVQRGGRVDSPAFTSDPRLSLAGPALQLAG